MFYVKGRTNDPRYSDSPNTVSVDILAEHFWPEYSAEIHSAILAGFGH